MTRKMRLLSIAFLAILVIGRSQVKAFAPQSINADQPYWPSFGYDQANTGYSPHLGPGPGPVEMAWFYPAVKGRVINQQQTVDSDGTVYFATWGWVDEEAEDYAHGLLYALNPDGTLKWVYDPGPADCPWEKDWCFGTIETSPAIGPDGTIYIGRGDGILRAVNPDGTLKWSFGTIPNANGRGQILSSPAVSRDGTIYFGTIANLLSLGFGNNVFYAVKDMGDHAELLWTYPEDAAEGGTLTSGVWSNPAIGPDGAVYFAVGHTIYAFWPDGTERWHKTTIYKMYTPTVGPDGTIYVQATGATGIVYALNPDGTKKWTFAVGEGETTVSKVSIGPDGTLYVGSGTREDDATPDPLDEPQNIGKLYALVDMGAQAETKWVVDFGSSVGAPAIDGDRFIYVGLRGDTSTQLRAGLSADPPVRGRAVALRDTRDSGEILWSVEARGELWLGKPVIGSNRTLYFADAMCMDYFTCDEDTDVPAVYAVRPAAPPAPQCVQDANGNGIGDVVDIETTASEARCQVYLPVVVANWRQPWPTDTPTLTPTPTSTPTPTPTPSAAYEPPIEITFNIHFDPVLSDYETWRERKDNLLWLKSFVEGYSGEYQPKLNLQVQGDHAEFYLGPDNPNDPAYSEAAEGRAALAALYQAGHTFGTHAHPTIRGDAPHSWSVIWGDATTAQSVENWQDHIGWADQLYAEITGNDDPAFLQRMNDNAVMILPRGLEAQRQAFAGTYNDPATGETVPHGFSIQTGGPNEAFICLFDHDVHNPWRPGTGSSLDEDLSNTIFVRIPQLTAVGMMGAHGSIPDCYQDTSLPSAQRMFLQVFVERLYHEYTGAEDTVWTFGWMEHLFNIYPTGSDSSGGAGPAKAHYEFREEAQGMVDWLNERFIGRTTGNGNLAARYATMTEVGDTFLTWEAEHPGVSSFEYSEMGTNWDAYPYDLKGLAQALANAHYDSALLPPDSTLQVYRFERCPSSLRGETPGYWGYESDGTFGCYDSVSNRGEPTGNPLPTTTVYMAWRDAAEPEPTDLTAYVGRHATAYDGVTGSFLGADDALNALPLNYRPVILLPGPAGPTPTPTPTPAGYLLTSYNANYLWGTEDHVGQAEKDEFVDTLERHLDLMDELGVTADYYFTGLAAEKLAEWSSETVTRLLNSDHGLNYHGANRPPFPQLVEQVQGEDWEEDVATARTYEADGINPATGEHVGGITAFREVFGQDPFATGRFFEASILYVDKEMGAEMAVGLKGNTGASRDDAWFLGVLNRPTQAGLSASGLARAAIEGRAEEYLAYARSLLTSVNGPMPLAVLPIHDHDFFAHIPANQEQVWDLYEQVLRLALDLGFQPVTMRDVYAMVQNGPAPTLSQQDLLEAAQSLVETMGVTGYPPEFVQENREQVEKGKRAKVEKGPFSLFPFSTSVAPLSLAEAFEGLARALAAYRQTGSLPTAVDTHDLLGPTAYFTSTATPATIPADAVLDAAVAVSAAITDRIPAQVTVGSQSVNPAEFLYLMAQEYTAIAGGEPTPVTLHPISILPLAVTQNQEADPLTKLQFWTYKPAVFGPAG